MGEMTETDRETLLALLEKAKESGLLSAATPAPAQYVQAQSADSSAEKTDVVLDAGAQKQLGELGRDIEWLKEEQRKQGERIKKLEDRTLVLYVAAATLVAVVTLIAGGIAIWEFVGRGS